MDDYISRADAIVGLEELAKRYNGTVTADGVVLAIDRIKALPSADAESDDLIIKGAKGIQDGLYNIKDGKLFKYKGKGGTVRTYPIVPSADAVSREFYEDAVKANIGLVIENRQLKEQIESAEAVQGEWEDKEVFNETDDDHIVDEWQSARCSVCGKYHTTPFMYYFDNFNYCPNCGARMNREDGEE